MIDVVHICVAMKPLEGNFASNALEHGVAGLNVDACRVAGATGFGSRDDGYVVGTGRAYQASGRWPANVLHDGSGEVTGQFPETIAKGHWPAQYGDKIGFNKGGKMIVGLERHSDSGSAARFFQECEPDDD